MVYDWSFEDERPVGMIVEMLLEPIAATYVRLQRLSRAEAEEHLCTWKERELGIKEIKWGRQVRPWETEPERIEIRFEDSIYLGTI